MRALFIVLVFLATSGKKSTTRVIGTPIGAPGGFLDALAKRAANKRKTKK